MDEGENMMQKWVAEVEDASRRHDRIEWIKYKWSKEHVPGQSCELLMVLPLNFTRIVNGLFWNVFETLKKLCQTTRGLQTTS